MCTGGEAQVVSLTCARSCLGAQVRPVDIENIFRHAHQVRRLQLCATHNSHINEMLQTYALQG